MWAEQLVAPHRFERVEVPTPRADELPEGKVIVQVLAGAICGSDVPIFRGGVSPNTLYSEDARYGPNPPGFPLHEVVGDVIASNSQLSVGQRVVGWAEATSGLCEQIIAEERSLHPIGSAHRLEPAEQTMIQPLACVLHALTRLPSTASQRVAVIGLGPIGLLFSHVMHSTGAADVTGVDPIDRSDVAGQFGIDHFSHSSSDRWAHTLDSAKAPNTVIEAVGHQVATLNHAIEAVANEGQIFYFGITDDPMYPIDMKRLQRKELTLVSGTTPFRYRRGALARAEQYINEHPDLPARYVTNLFDIKEVEEAYECASRPAQGRIKVVINW